MTTSTMVNDVENQNKTVAKRYRRGDNFNNNNAGGGGDNFNNNNAGK